MSHENTTYSGHLTEGIRERIRQYILVKLGHPVVRVELDDQAIDTAINTALSNFSQWVPGTERLKVFDLVPGQSVYGLKETLGTDDYINVRQVIYSRYSSFSTVGEFVNNFLDGGLYPEWGFGGYSGLSGGGTYGGNMSDFVIQGMYNEQFIRTLGLEGTWEVLNEQLRLYPSPTKPGKAGVIYTTYIGDMNLRRTEWVREWSLAEAKEILGEIRSKYAAMPGPRGGTVQLNGGELKNEAAAMKEQLLKRLDEYIEPIGFITG